MSYQLRKDEKLGPGLRRICRKQIEFAIVIATGEKKSSDTPVHEMRKHAKKARAALRLVRCVNQAIRYAAHGRNDDNHRVLACCVGHNLRGTPNA